MKKLSALFGSLGLLASSALPAFAQSVDPCRNTGTGGTDFSRLCAINASSLPRIIQTVITVLLIAAVLIALFFLIWGGIRWITSGGDKGKVEEARKHIVAAIIGLIIAFLAYFILQVVLGFFGIGLGELALPRLVP